jgi:hypothetical protein
MAAEVWAMPNPAIVLAWRPEPAWNDLTRLEYHRQRETDGSPQRIYATHGILSVPQLGDDIARPFEELLPRCGQGEASRGAQQKLHA